MTAPNRVPFVREADNLAQVEEFVHLSKSESLLYRGSTLVLPSDSTRERLTLVGGLGSTVMGTLRMVHAGSGSWFIENVFVLKECREIGIGDALMLRALEILSGLKATRVESSAMPGDRATKNLFERHGLVAQTILVGKTLSDPSTEEHASQ